MELLLNIVWLTIALLALVRFGVWTSGEPDRRRVALVGVATVCALAVLFPIISMSDDLQATVAAVEETMTGRRIVVAFSMHLAFADIALLASHCSLVIVLIALGFTTENALAPSTSPDARVFSLRGPPSVAC
jgi:hypothetical protein